MPPVVVSCSAPPSRLTIMTIGDESRMNRATNLRTGATERRSACRPGCGLLILYLREQPHADSPFGTYARNERQRRCPNRRRPTRGRSRAAPGHPLIAQIVHLDRSLLVNSRNFLSMLL